MTKKHNHSHAPSPEHDLNRVRVSAETIIRQVIGKPRPPWRALKEPLPVSRAEVIDYLEGTIKAAEVAQRIVSRIRAKTDKNCRQ